jgi:hypothetical protein
MPGMTSAKASVKASYFKFYSVFKGNTPLLRKRIRAFNWYFKGIAVFLTGIDISQDYFISSSRFAVVFS